MLRVDKDGFFMVTKDFPIIPLGTFIFDIISSQFAVENIRFFMPDPADINKPGEQIPLTGITSSIVLSDETEPGKQVAEFSSKDGANLVVSPNNFISAFFDKQEMINLSVDDFAYIWFLEKGGIKYPIFQGLIRIL